MSDFPTPGVLPQFVHPWTIYGCGTDVRLHAATGTGGPITWVANTAVYMPVSIPWAYPVKRVFWINGSTATTTNVDFGIYTTSGARIYHTGSTAMSGASVTQYVTPSPDFILSPGNYYFGWVCDNTTSRAFGLLLSTAGQMAMAGVLTQALGSAVLPTTATFATGGTTVGTVYCGITRTPSGF